MTRVCFIGGLEWTLGEIVAETSELRSVVFTKGFNQPNFTSSPIGGINGPNGIDYPEAGNPNNLSLDINFLPNPFENELTISVAGDRYSTIHASLFSTEGVLLRENSIPIHETNVKFEVSDLPSAIYIVYIQDGSGAISESHRVFKFK